MLDWRLQKRYFLLYSDFPEMTPKMQQQYQYIWVWWLCTHRMGLLRERTGFGLVMFFIWWLCISTSFRVLAAPESWSKHFFQPFFDLFCSFQSFFPPYPNILILMLCFTALLASFEMCTAAHQSILSKYLLLNSNFVQPLHFQKNKQQ